jgi:hypothetical protein
LEHIEAAFAHCNNSINGAAPLIFETPVAVLCDNQPSSFSCEVNNLGSEAIEQLAFQWSDNADGVLDASTAWSGSIPPGASQWIEVGAVTSPGNYPARISAVNGSDTNIPFEVEVLASEESTRFLRLHLKTDSWGEETSWQLLDANGQVLDGVAPNTLSDNTTYEWWLELPEEGCYSFVVSDVWGDGMNGAQWGGGAVSGWFTLESHADWTSGVPDESTYLFDVFSYDGSYDFDDIRFGLTTVDLIVTGCTDPEACNYLSYAEEEDGSCTYPGCLDSEASNYDPEAGCDGPCNYLILNCTSLGNSAWQALPIGFYSESQSAWIGVPLAFEYVFNIPAVMQEGPFQYPISHLTIDSIAGVPEGLTASLSATGTVSANTQHCITVSGVGLSPGVYTAHVHTEVFLQLFGTNTPVAQSWPFQIHLTENPNGIPGCTYSTASNYNPIATFDNGSCDWAGCMDAAAANFNPWATSDDGSCETEPACSSDNNGDGVVNISDLLMVLGEFGQQCGN